MNQSELAKVLGVSRTAVKNWVTLGMPCHGETGHRGKSQSFNLAEVTSWIEKNGKGQTPRVDRPGLVARISAAAQQQAMEEPPAASEAQATYARGVLDTIDFFLDNFPVAAAWMIREQGMEPCKAVDMSFDAVFSLAFVAAVAHGAPLGNFPPRAQAYLSESEDVLQELATVAQELTAIWSGEDQDG